ncbi:glycerate kinase [Maribellus sediminis]|uniref:glycerate kinase n=1 Tax=Maribellus sediminis TaxID=2696285 RepID=UPI001430C279|nr:glycerate kinase [Maribellus sediminis]
MKILIAPNSMKGSLNAFDFADTVGEAFLACTSDFEIRKLPVADGGDFTGEVLARNFNAQTVSLYATGPLGQTVASKYAISGKKAIIEMADASGMKLVAMNELNPMIASSFGTGQLILDAISKECEEIFLAIGGSATVDGGMGMMEALGFKFFDKNGTELSGNGRNLGKVHSIVKKELPANLKINIVCDVDNPLLGSNGAAAVFGPQKGATSEGVKELEKGLENWATVLEMHARRTLQNIPGMGAAGGISLPLMAFLNAEIVPGADFVLEQLQFSEQVKWADLVITGEGRIDSQTLNNKAPFAVAKVARRFNKSVIAIGGKVEVEASEAFDGIFSLVNGPVNLQEAMQNSRQLLFNFSSQLARTIKSLSR